MPFTSEEFQVVVTCPATTSIHSALRLLGLPTAYSEIDPPVILQAAYGPVREYLIQVALTPELAAELEHDGYITLAIAGDITLQAEMP